MSPSPPLPVGTRPFKWDIAGKWECQKRLVLEWYFLPLNQNQLDSGVWIVFEDPRPWFLNLGTIDILGQVAVLCFVGCLLIFLASTHLMPVSPCPQCFHTLADPWWAKWPLIENYFLDQHCKEEYARRVGLELRNNSDNQHPALLQMSLRCEGRKEKWMFMFLWHRLLYAFFFPPLKIAKTS